MDKDVSPLTLHQRATMRELGEALSILREELAWTSAELERARIAERTALEERDRLKAQLEAIHSSSTWRAGRVLVGPVARLRRAIRG